jgi:PAS domain S-box-containing protein
LVLESEETFRSAFEQSGIGMSHDGLDGRVLRVNRALCAIVGYEERELLARTFQDITHAGDLGADLDLMQALLSGARDWYALEKRYVRQDGRVVWVLLHGSVVRDAAGAPRLFVSQVQDVTERKDAEAALARQHVELARSNAELEQFAYVASHDLQEPLRAIASYTQLLADRYAPQLDDRARRYIRYAVQGAERMRALIEDVLALSRVGSQAQAFAPVALEAVLDAALQQLGPAIRESGATITRTPLPTVRGAAAQLAQLLQNLVANAIKFRRPDAAPAVHVSAHAEAGAWTISVRDDGIGIAPRFHDRVFAVFKRLHTQDEYPGTGMGLAICKKVVERHGGRIWVESVPNEGATFRFTIPV